jgi:hypothetical protein
LKRLETARAFALEIDPKRAAHQQTPTQKLDVEVIAQWGKVAQQFIQIFELKFFDRKLSAKVLIVLL